MNAIVFAASEVGSARALLPVCELSFERKIPFAVLDRGSLGREANPDWNALKTCPDDSDGMRDFLLEGGAEVLVFSVNVKDPLPLKLARVASSFGIPTIHVLDYWNGYRFRMQMDGGESFSPDYYVVPDDIAARYAVSEGIDPTIIVIAGQPAFSDAVASFEVNAVDRSEKLSSLGLDPGKKTLLFVSEPVAMDFGRSVQENSGFKGYTEQDVISIFLQAISHGLKDFEVCVLPHPRENVASLKMFWSKSGGETAGRVVPGVRGRDLLPFVSGVLGMASTLLYEAWLVGVPVMSLQPGLCQDSLRVMQQREGVTFLDKKDDMVSKIQRWLLRVDTDQHRGAIRDEAKLHKNASEHILMLADKYMRNSVLDWSLEKR